jgi:glutathione reductase (NADPH)
MYMNARYDVVILGGGNAGMGVTVATRKAGLSVAMIEQDVLGGVCPNRGCTPKKVLVAAGHSLHEIERAHVHCIAVSEPNLDWAGLIEREKKMIAHIPGSLANLMKSRGVEVIKGRGRFAAPNRVSVEDQDIEARHIVIAAGSVPRKLPIPGAELMIGSDELLSDRTRPQSIVFIGGGVIAFEFAHVLARAGTEVTIVEVLPRPLAQFDADAVEQVRKESERIGIRIMTGAKVHRIEKAGSRLRTTVEHDGKEQAIESDRVANGAGRVADVDGLDLAAGGVEHDKGRIATDEFLHSTSNPNVWVCGDVLWSSPQLSPIATYEGRIVGANIVEGPKRKPDYAPIPSAVYTTPAIAMVGLTEEAARAKGLKFTAPVNDMSDWFSSLTFAETVSWAKVLVEEGSDRILGAHMVGHAGEELIHLFAFAMKFGVTAGQIRDFVFSFPTYSADIKSLV